VTQVSLGQVFDEIKRMQLELRTIEKSLDSLAESLIPEGEKLSPEEIKELDVLEKEMEEGHFVPLEEVLKKHEVTKRGKVSAKRSPKSR
jgi:hypothetical protein